MLLADWMARRYDVEGAFLMGKFENGEEIFMKVPQGIEHHYWGLAVLRLLKPMYGLKQAAFLFWQRLLKIMKSMGHKHSIADPCIYFYRNKTGELAIWQIWLDDNLIVVLPHVVKDKGKKLTKEIEIEDVSKLIEFVGCKIKLMHWKNQQNLPKLL